MTSEQTDRDIIRVRLRFLDLLKSFFCAEPDAEKMGRWRGTFAALAHQQINPPMDSAVRRLNALLSGRSLEDLYNEYYILFIDPYSEHPLATTLSYYIDGHSYGPSLARLRGFLQQAGLTMDKKFSESEDSLVVMLDALATLVTEEKNDYENARRLQAGLLAGYLEPFIDKFTTALEKNQKTEFYAACGLFLSAYLELEKGLTEGMEATVF